MGFFDSLEQFFDFDSAAYGREINQLNQYQLYTLHKTLQRKVVGLAGTGVLGIAAAPYTACVSLVGSGIAARRLEVNMHRIDIVEARLREQRWAGHDFSTKDLVIGLAPGVAAITLVPAADHAFGLFSGNTAAGAAAHHTVDVVAGSAHHTVDRVAGPAHFETGHDLYYRPAEGTVATSAHQAADAAARFTHQNGASMAKAAARLGVQTGMAYAVDSTVRETADKQQPGDRQRGYYNSSKLGQGQGN